MSSVNWNCLSCSVLFSLFTLAVKTKSVSCVCRCLWISELSSNQGRFFTRTLPGFLLLTWHCITLLASDCTTHPLLPERMVVIKAPGWSHPFLPPRLLHLPPLFCPLCSMLILLVSEAKWCSLLVIEHPLPGCWQMENKKKSCMCKNTLETPTYTHRCGQIGCSETPTVEWLQGSLYASHEPIVLWGCSPPSSGFLYKRDDAESDLLG